jgi:hypothetical protein
MRESIHTALKTFCKYVFSLCLGMVLGFPASAICQTTGAAPLELAQTFQLTPDVTGNFDHIEVDLKRNRIFVTPEDYKQFRFSTRRTASSFTKSTMLAVLMQFSTALIRIGCT